MLRGALVRAVLIVKNRGGHVGREGAPWTHHQIFLRITLLEWLAAYAAKCIGWTASGITSLSEKNITSAPLYRDWAL